MRFSIFTIFELSILSTSILLIKLPIYVEAFGNIGHFIIGETTQRFLPDSARNTLERCKYIEQFNNSLGRASSWADSLKRNPRFKWTSPLHYFDIDNDPPGYCGRVVIPESKKALNLINGLRRNLYNLTGDDTGCGSFFHFNLYIHLLEDMHQPLHLTGKERGGNELSFTDADDPLSTKKYNLHRFWDSTALEMLMIDQFGKDYTMEQGVNYFYEELTEELSESGSNFECPLKRDDVGKDTLKNYGKKKGDPKTDEIVDIALKQIVKYAEPVLQQNCKLVWRYSETGYIEKSKETIKELVKDSIRCLYCMLLYVL